MFSGLGGLIVCSGFEICFWLVSCVGPTQIQISPGGSLSRIVLSVDVIELPVVSFGFPDPYILFALCCSELRIFVV